MISPDSPFVVTRPAPDHQQLIVRLGELGIPAIHSPAFEIEPAPDALLGEKIRGLAAFKLVIVTSPVSARLIASRAADSDLQGIDFVAPGRGTASVLQAAGLRCGFPDAGGTSEDILEMPDFAGVDGTRIAIVGAPGGRGLLARELARRGAWVEAVHVYRRNVLLPAPELVSALHRRRDPVVLISSLQAFAMISDALDDELKPAWTGSRFVVSSGRLETACREAGVSRIQRADGASDDQMLAAAAEAGWMPAQESTEGSESGHPDTARTDDFR